MTTSQTTTTVTTAAIAAPAVAARLPPTKPQNTTTTLARSPSTLTRSASVSSLTARPHFVTAPCTRCGHAEPIKSLLSVVDTSIYRCPHCPESHSVSSKTVHPGASEMLYQSFDSLESSLQRHGADLQRLSVLMPSISREPSLRSVRMIDDDAQSKAPSYMGNPLVHDVEDLKQLTAGVTRLLRTLHEKVLRLDRDEKLLRAEREELAKERGELTKERENIDQLRDMLVVGGLGREGGDGSFSPVASRGVFDRGKSMDLTPEEMSRKSLPMSRALSFATDDDPGVFWSEEKEFHLQQLERQLTQANMKWSDEQEDVLPMVERMREERRKAKKFGRSFLNEFHGSGIESPRRRVPSFVLNRKASASGRSSRRGSDGEEAAKEKGGNRLMRFFSKKDSAHD